LSRLRVFIFDSSAPVATALPDVTTPAWAAQQAQEMLDMAESADSSVPRAGITQFVRGWLKLNASVAPDAVDVWARVLVSTSGTLPMLLTMPYPTDAQRIGIWSDPYFLRSNFTISGRGAVMSDALFAGVIPPPLDPAVHRVGVTTPSPGVTERQALVASTASSPVCLACHESLKMDVLGFSLGHFDATGTYRDFDNGSPVDSSGTYTAPWGTVFAFNGISDFSQQFADSCGVARRFAERLLNDVIQRNLQACAPDCEHAFVQPAPSAADVDAVFRALAGDRSLSLRAALLAVVQTQSFLQ
jgi:hypothetical protein